MTNTQKPSYEAKIKNISKGTWYGGISKAGNPIHSKDEKNAVLFWDKDEAELELIYLNDQLKDCYTLIDYSTPLWKVLNEQRTQGEWTAKKLDKNHSLVHSEDGMSVIPRMITEPGNPTQANAQYTALAVNNFANVVEALEIAQNYVENFIAKGGIGEGERDLAAIQKVLKSIS